MSNFIFLNRCVLLMLTCLFLWISFQALQKLLKEDIGVAQSTEDSGDPFLYPEVIFCLASLELRALTDPNSIENLLSFQALEKAGGITLTKATHGPYDLLDPQLLANYSSSLSDVFKSVYITVNGDFNKCIKITSPIKMSIGSNNALRFSLKSPPDGYFIVAVLIGQGNHLPMNNRLFGGDYVVFSKVPGMEMVRAIDITKVKKTYLTTEERPCSEKPSAQGLTECVINYIHKELGCTLGYTGIQEPGKSNCSELDAMTIFRSILSSFEDITEIGLINMTKCLPKCTNDEYFTSTKLVVDKPKTDENEADASLQFVFTQTSVNVQEQVRLFTSHSFIAEVGGFLGLLLGASIYTMVQFLQQFGNNLFGSKKIQNK